MNQGILSKYDDLRVVFDEPRAREVGSDIGQMDRARLDRLFVQGELRFGGAIVHETGEGESKLIAEMVVSGNDADSMTVLYAPHPVFNSRQTYIEARRELIECITDIKMADGPDQLYIACPTRKRPAPLRHLALIQLVDLLRGLVGQFQGKRTLH